MSIYQIGTKVVIDTHAEGRVTATITAIDYDGNDLWYTVRWPTESPGVHDNTRISPSEIIKVIEYQKGK